MTDCLHRYFLNSITLQWVWKDVNKTDCGLLLGSCPSLRKSSINLSCRNLPLHQVTELETKCKIIGLLWSYTYETFGSGIVLRIGWETYRNVLHNEEVYDL
jgi:hypothetical protein